ncbi:MAG: ABC transporter ATP-binding protein, partial [Alphaproteobacteria bacterium]
PTNDLDLETLDLLQEMLADYPGTLLLISHDRDFLDRVVTSVIACEGDGRWTDYPGGYSDMVVQRGAGVTKAPPPPPARRKKAPSSRPANKTMRLSFKDKHALETLPAKIDELQAEIESGLAALDDAGLYARDASLFEKTAAALGHAEAALAQAEEQWLALELKREEIEGS